jgi:hypothetical protein
MRVLKKGKYLGKVGTVYTTKKTRVWVEIPGIAEPAYVSASEVEPDDDRRPWHPSLF